METVAVEVPKAKAGTAKKTDEELKNEALNLFTRSDVD
jgi:hypothetical protein